ncbi:septal ring factor EnvC (AmiA/AmiB activator) [Hypnocyclicus thermotrophus]|uniref:Septal ring factor EnvC (AmiA/AmiB activator) n=1 Tax=Hypnocyclicus thermotrophus TaxID=1627895 RepID=A0AA46DZD8_9FUSO|nr:peptidoglycan DD-metalloendopeptidase family protein [Hypnocyclicus thermotrophus]TDT71734.1 septal ring factor EnvC (AmiA/AmiB activator) [Hypnocyclicus thermotrophus]
MKNKILIIIIFLFSISYGEDLDTIRAKVNNIDKTIEKNKTSIVEAKKKEKEILKKLDRIENELSKITSDYSEMLKKYNTLNKNVEYAEKNLKIIDEELLDITLQYQNVIKKIETKFYLQKELLNNIENEFKKDEYISLLNNFKEKISKINYFKTKVEEVQEKILLEKNEIGSLTKKLYIKQKEMKNKQKEHATLVKQLKRQEYYLSNRIQVLRKEKLEAEKQIEKIIQERAKQAGIATVQIILKQLGEMLVPVKGKIIKYFGEEKINDITMQGIEIKSYLGADVKAINKGKVIFAQKFSGLGNLVMIDHGYNFVSVYGNLIKLNVKEGEIVSKGENIGLLGFSSDREPVLYFETRVSAVSTDPIIFLKK